MASKFQKQLVGTVVLVTASVIFIPSLLDGQKRYNETQEKVIPLIPDANEASAQWQYDPTAFMAHAELANEIPEHIEAPNYQQSNQAGEYAQTNSLTINQTVNQQAFNSNNQQGAAQQLSEQTGQLQQNTATQAMPANPPQNRVQTVNSTKPVQPNEEQNRANVANRTQTPVQSANSGAINNQSPTNVTATTTSNNQQNNNSSQNSQYVIQLAALSNASKADEIVQKLSAAGYSAYTVPSNKLTRIYVGPSQSKQELNNKLAELNRITGLQGQVVKTK